MTNLTVSDLTVEYRTGAEVVRPLDRLSFAADGGQLLLLLGPSGSGKTSLLSCLAGILTPAGGKVVVEGLEVSALTGRALSVYRQRVVGIVFQGFNLVASLTAAENVAVPLWAAGWRRRPALDRARGLLAQLDLAHREKHRPGQLSGGQQQRVAIARSLAHDPPVILADEPTAHLDYVQAEVVLRTLRGLANAGRVVIVATHDARILPLADGVVDLTAGSEPDVALCEDEATVAEGRTIFAQGDPADVVFVVKTGQVRLTRELSDGTTVELATCWPGDYFGELGPLLGFPRSATATATRPTVVARYTVAAFRQKFGPLPSWGAMAETTIEEAAHR